MALVREFKGKWQVQIVGADDPLGRDRQPRSFR